MLLRTVLATSTGKGTAFHSEFTAMHLMKPSAASLPSGCRDDLEIVGDGLLLDLANSQGNFDRSSKRHAALYWQWTSTRGNETPNFAHLVEG